MATASQVTSLYRSILKRAPDSGGLRFYQGWSDVNAIKRDMLGSAEYRKLQARARTSAKKKPAAKPRPTQVQSLFSQLGSFDAKAKNPIDMYNQALDRLGISDARTRVQDLRSQLMNTENLLRNVEGDVSGRTQNSLVTENQRRKLVASEQEPLTNLLDVLGGNFDVANQDYTSTLSEGEKQAQLEFEGQRTQRQSLMDRLQIAIGEAKTAEDKRRWTAEYNRLKAKDAEARRQFDLQLALKREQLAKASAPSGGGGGGYSRSYSSGGGSSGSGGVSSSRSSATRSSTNKSVAAQLLYGLKSGGLKVM